MTDTASHDAPTERARRRELDGIAARVFGHRSPSTGGELPGSESARRT
jgi:hypothetical protein